ncbi:MAG: DUF1289 domain-containing protein [Porticoccaceae bacterium]|nr:DUF1289 domain-containing protein [Porticoccaceae bacterium]
MAESATTLRSPCIAICRLDEQDVCTGCYRTLDEIRRWRCMTDSERSLVLTTLKSRNVNRP